MRLNSKRRLGKYPKKTLTCVNLEIRWQNENVKMNKWKYWEI